MYEQSNYIYIKKTMRQPTIKTDYWELRSAEESHAKYGDDFWIPALEDRQAVARGQAVRLIFDIETDNEGKAEVGGERMWVIVSEKVDDTYIGILDNQPACLDPDADFYLGFGVEIPFKAEHIISIDQPPQDYVEEVLGEAPARNWPR